MAKIFSGSDSEWDTLITPHLYSGAVLQSSVWARVQQARGNPCVRVVDDLGNPTLWVALPIKTGLWVWYSPKGPLAMPAADEWKAIVEILQKEKRASVLRIEPPHKFLLKQGDFIFSRRADISPTHSLLTDISVGEEKILKSFHEKTRYNIRVAAKHGVVVKRLSSEEIALHANEIFKLYHQTGGRHRIAATPSDDLRALFQVCDVWVAEHEGKILATSLHMKFGTMMTYLHGASDYEERAHMAPYALHWAVIQGAHQRGCEMYDWWGIAPTDDDITHKLSGVTRFKLGFGGTRVQSSGTFDAGIDRIRFALYTALRRIKRP